MKQGSQRRLGRRTFLKGALATAPLLALGPSLLRPGAARASTIGPSTTTEPYMLPSVPGVRLVSILTVGDAVGGYRLVGIPDGLGAFVHRLRHFTLIANHEITATNGIARAHGSKGAFVSRWTIDRRTLEVVKGEDFTPSPLDVFQWDVATQGYVAGTTVFERHCSADLPRRSAFFHNGKGTLERIYMNGEEVSQGRAWARVATGQHAGEAWQLPRFGRLAYENAVACPHGQDKTIVVLTDDGALSTAPIAASFPSEVYVYVGTKTRRGHPVERAGLTNGKLYGLKVSVKGQPVAEESNEFGLGDATTGFVGSGRFSLFNLGDVSSLDGLRARAGVHHQRRHSLPAVRGRRLGPSVPAPRQLLLRHHGQPDPQLPPVAPELRRHRASRAGRHHRDPAQGRRGPRHARQRDDRSLGPHPHRQGPRQQPAGRQALALPGSAPARSSRWRPTTRSSSTPRCPTTRRSSPRTRSPPASSTPAISSAGAGSSSTSRSTRSAPTPSWSRADSSWRCSSIPTSDGTSTTSTSVTTTTRTTTTRNSGRSRRERGPGAPLRAGVLS